MKGVKILEYLFLLLIIAQIECSDTTFISPKYTIPSYFGSRVLDFNYYRSIIESNYSSFYWNGGFQTDERSKKSWFVDHHNHVIQQVSSQGEVRIILGIYGLQGFRNGDSRNSILNEPNSVFFFHKNETRTALSKYKQISIAKNDLNCLYANSQNFSSCLVFDATMNNDLNSVLQYTLINNTNQIKDIYDDQIDILSSGSSNQNTSDQFSDYINQSLTRKILNTPTIYFSDSGNHCIRKFDLITELTSTVAGQCGKRGFQDGPLGINRIGRPQNLGVDDEGFVFFFDGESHYIRMVDPETSQVSTLIQGACKEDDRIISKPKQTGFGLDIKQIICFKSWIKTFGAPKQHIFVDQTSNTCNKHTLECTGDF